MEKNIEKLL